MLILNCTFINNKVSLLLINKTFFSLIHALYITTGNILGWVFYYANSSSRSDFFVDIWRPVDNKQFRLVKSTKITPNQEKTVEVIRIRVISIYYDYDYNVTLQVRLWGVN